MSHSDYPFNQPIERKIQQKQEKFLAQNHKLIAHLPLQTASPQYKNSHKPNSPLLITGKVRRHALLAK